MNALEVAVIELEDAKVGLIDPAHPHADELIGFGLDLLETDNLPVILAAIPSREAAKHHHHRFSRSFCELASFFIVGKLPKIRAGLDAAPLGLVSLDKTTRCKADSHADADQARQRGQKKPDTASEPKLQYGHSPEKHERSTIKIKGVYPKARLS